jgi:hypothetical protein
MTWFTAKSRTNITVAIVVGQLRGGFEFTSRGGTLDRARLSDVVR